MGILGECGVDDLSGIDLVHAAVIAWALAQEAGTALDVAADDLMTVAKRGGPGGFGGAEDGDRGHTEGGREVHGAGVVADYQIAVGEFVTELGDAGLPGPVDGSNVGDQIGELRGELGFIGGSENVKLASRVGGARFFLNGKNGLGVSLDRPAFGISVLGSGANADASR